MRTIEEIKEVFKTHLDIDENSVVMIANKPALEDSDDVSTAQQLLEHYSGKHHIHLYDLPYSFITAIRKNNFSLDDDVNSNWPLLKKTSLGEVIKCCFLDVYDFSELNNIWKADLEYLDSICNEIEDWACQQQVSSSDYER